MPWTCLVKTCDSNKSKKVNNNVSTFKVPDKVTEKTLYEKWLAAIPDCSVLKKNHRICEKHFRKGQIIKEFVSRDHNGKLISKTLYKHPRLVKGAIPCIFSKPLQLNSHVYNEHAYVTKSSNFSDLNPHDESCIQTDQPESNEEFNKCMSQKNEINSKDCWTNNIETTTNEQWTSHQFMDSSNFCDFDKGIDNKKLSKNAARDKSTFDETVIGSNRLSKLRNHHILGNSATTAIFQSVTFDFDGKSGNPNARIKLIIDLVKPWNAARAVFGNEEYLILSHIVETVVSGKKSHIIEKAVLITKDRKIMYEVYGRPCDVDHSKLPKFLENVTRLTEILKRFKDLPVCKGVQIFNFNFLTSRTKTFYEQSWRPDDCTLISPNEDRCLGCQKQIKILSVLNYRRKKNTKLQRVSRLSNPLDQRKLKAMQKTMKHRTRRKSILKKRLNLLE